MTFGRLTFEERDEAEIAGLYRDWLTVAESVAATLAEHEQAGRSYEHADLFRQLIQDARGICTPDEVFFAGPKLEALRDQAIADFFAGRTVEMREIGD